MALSLMDIIFWTSGDVFVGRPLVTENGRSRQYKLVDDGQKSRSIPLLDKNCVTFAGVTIYPTKYPLNTDGTTVKFENRDVLTIKVF
jgi:hypothetical protein